MKGKDSSEREAIDAAAGKRKPLPSVQNEQNLIRSVSTSPGTLHCRIRGKSHSTLHLSPLGVHFVPSAKQTDSFIYYIRKFCWEARRVEELAMNLSARKEFHAGPPGTGPLGQCRDPEEIQQQAG